MMMRYEYDDIVKVVSHKRVIKNMTMKYEDDDDDDNDDDDNDADDDDNDDDDDADDNNDKVVSLPTCSSIRLPTKCHITSHRTV